MVSWYDRGGEQLYLELVLPLAVPHAEGFCPRVGGDAVQNHAEEHGAYDGCGDRAGVQSPPPAPSPFRCAAGLPFGTVCLAAGS